MNASGFRAQAREALSGRWLLAVGTTLLATILGGSVTMVNEGGSVGSSFSINGRDLEDTGININSPEFERMLPILATVLTAGAIISLVHFIIGGFISLGLIKFNLALIDGQEASVNDIFSQTSRIGSALWLRLRMQIFTFLWALLFIIPGIIKSYAYSMAGYIAYENPDMTAKEAMTISQEMMKGNKWRLFCLQLSFIGWSLLSVLTCGIGMLWVNAYANSATTAFYNEISRDYQARNN